MVHGNNLNDEVSKTLNSFEDTMEVKVKPYFHTRLRAKMDYSQKQASIAWKWSMAVVAVVVLANTVSLFSLWPEPEQTEEVIELMASEYSLMNTDIYNSILE